MPLRRIWQGKLLCLCNLLLYRSTSYLSMKSIIFLVLALGVIGCSSTYNSSIEADEAMPQLIDEGSTDEFN